ncbi:DUF4282 domain-containing protein [Devosia sp.]|jgi:hypothetical protein|uniref:DUF4282 domain-containing protein n=1 Tax=Devosia sp. TaxID=1871048 RepID=UPI0037BEBD23
MTLDDLKKIFLSPTLFRLDTILAPRLVPVLYAAGLAALLLWAVIHLFATFGRTFGDGLWGLLEIGVFGLFGLIVLRIVCEFLLVFFKVNETATRTVSLSLVSSSLLDDVRDAISDMAEDATPPETEVDVRDLPVASTPRPAVRRTAKRTPPSKPEL